jgi:ABC-2 type transport system ATP-binding protein
MENDRKMLEADDLWKSYGTKAAVAGVSFAACAGEIVGLLGPNGAGKSTPVAMLGGLTEPDRGSVTVAGEPVGSDANAAKRRIGLVPQEISLFEDLAAMRNLELFGALYGLAGAELRERAREALAIVGLEDRARAKPATFSGGMKRRLNIACALVHDPAVLLLDEPTVGVDPQSRNAIFENLEALRLRGKALVYTTHYMEEAERLCDRIVIVDHGRVIASGTRESLRGLARASSRRLEVEGPVDDAVLALLAARGVRVKGAAASLEDVFLELTGRELRD